MTDLNQNKDFFLLKEVSSVCLQQSLRNLDRLYSIFFKKRVHFPTFKTKNIRHDFHHKLSTQLIRENQAIIIEGLDIKSMLKNKRYAKEIW